MDTVSIVRDVVVGLGLGYASWQAKRAKKLSEPTGNGFARDVTDALRRIESKVDSHISAHADNDIRRHS